MTTLVATPGIAMAAFLLSFSAAVGPVDRPDSSDTIASRSVGAPGPSIQSQADREERTARYREGIRHFVDRIFALHPAPFAAHSRAEWESSIEELQEQAPRLDDATLFVGLSSLVGMLRDGHTSIWLDGDSPLFQASVPLRFWRFSDGVFVRAARADHARLLGARVLAVQGVPIEDAWELIVASRPGETDAAGLRSAALLMQIPEYLRALGVGSVTDQLTLQIESTTGDRSTVSIAAETLGNFGEVWDTSIGLSTPRDWVEPDAAPGALWLEQRGTPYWSRFLEDDATLYVQINRASRHVDAGDPERDVWASFVGNVARTAAQRPPQRVVIDLRHNRGGDSSMWQLLAHALVRSAELDRPGGIQVLIGRLTESAAVVMATKLEQETNALFVGEPTASRPNFYNDHRPWPDREVFLIEGTAIRMRISRIVEQWSAPQDRRTTLLPDVPVELAWADFAMGRDPVLAAARAVSPSVARALFVQPDGVPLTEPWSRPWRASQRPAWQPLR